MPNIFKYSLTLEPNTIKIGNWLIANEDIGYGDTPRTDYWNGVDIPDKSYLWAENKVSQGPSYMIGDEHQIVELIKHEANSNFNFDESNLNTIYNSTKSSNSIEYLIKTAINWVAVNPEYLLINKYYLPITNENVSLDAVLEIDNQLSLADIKVYNSPIGTTYSYAIYNSGASVSGTGNTIAASFSISNIDISGLPSGYINLDFDIYATNSISESLLEPTFALGGKEGFSYSDGNINAFQYNDDSVSILNNSFSRASSGYIINEANKLEEILEDTPRIQTDNGVSYLLLEPTSTNFITRNDIYDAISIAGSYNVVVENFVEDVYGGNLAHKITTNRDAGQDSNVRYFLFTNVAIGNTYTFSGWFKGSTNFSIEVDISDQTLPVYNITTEWQYFTNTLTYTRINPSNFSDIRFQTTGLGVVDLYVYGYQVEEQNTATSTIITKGSGLTRLYDDFFTGLNDLVNRNIIGNNKGMVYIDFYDSEIYKETTTNISIINLTEGGFAKYLRIRGRGNSTKYVQFINFTTGNALIPISAIPGKLLIKWDGVNVSVFENGVLLGQEPQTSTFNPTYFDSNGVAAPTKIRDFRIYNDVMNDENCKKITT